MKIAFIDIAANYTGLSPQTDALGGTQAAVCYLGAALARAGHDVSLINQNRVAGVFGGLTSIPPEQLDNASLLESCDVLVINGRWTKKLVETLRGKAKATAQAVVGTTERRATKIIGWMHEAAFNDPWILPLPEFDGFAFVSNWQKNTNAPLVPAHAKIAVMPNGIAPAFHTLFNDADIVSAKTNPPTAIYAGNSKRGLMVLPHIIPALRARIPDLNFEIYSDCNIDNDETAKNHMQQHLLALAGVVHVGAVSQAELPARFKRASYFISPNTYPETFCICLAEAMAAGCLPIITARGALPETAAGFAALVPVSNAAINTNSVNFEKDALDITAFVNAAAHAITAHEALPNNEKAAILEKQITFASTQYNWDKHAASWIDFLKF